MKKIFLLMAMPALFSFETQAQTCTVTPECAVLGYKYEAAQCDKGGVMCPNGNGYYCPNPRAKCKIGDIYYTDNTCVAAANHDTSKTALGVVVYVNPNGVGGQVMSDRIGQTWFSGRDAFDIPNLPNYTNATAAAQDFNSCKNTDIIIEALGESYAAYMARQYAPTKETKGKWCLPAAGVIQSLSINRSIIRTSMQKLGRTQYAASSTCNWSSTEYNAIHAWMSCNLGGLIVSNNSITGDYNDPNDKDDGNYYFAVLEF